jgi:hypothetical protein
MAGTRIDNEQLKSAGASGPTGPAGPTGATGPQGATGAGGATIVKGAASITTGGGTSGSVVVTHGLGSTPTAVVVTPSAQLVAPGISFTVTAIGSTTFTINCFINNAGSASYSATVYWIAL